MYVCGVISKCCGVCCVDEMCVLCLCDCVKLSYDVGWWCGVCVCCVMFVVLNLSVLLIPPVFVINCGYGMFVSGDGGVCVCVDYSV